MLVTLSTSAISQVYYTYSNRIGVWDNYIDNWRWGKINSERISISVKDGKIILGNVARTTLTIISSAVENFETSSDGYRYKSTRWTARDQDGRKCFVSLVKYMDPEISNSFNIMYDDLAFKYFFSDISGLDKFRND